MITATALENEVLKRIFSTYRATCPAPDGSERVLVNHNRLLRSYEGCIGVKTGYTSTSGRCLVTAAERDELRLVAVTLDDGNDWEDHTLMLDRGFETYQRITLADISSFVYPSSLPLPSVAVIGGEQTEVSCKLDRTVKLTIPKDGATINCRIEMTRMLFAPIEPNQEIGRIVWYCNGTELASARLLTAYSACARDKVSLFSRILSFFWIER